MSNRWYTQFLGSHHKKPVIIDCNFTVDSTNGNGFGARSLKGAGVQNVYMNTSASFIGTTHTSTTIDGIPGGTSSLKVGMQISGSGITAGTLITAILSSGSIQISIATSSSVVGTTIHYAAVGAPGSTLGPAAGLIYVTFQDNFNYYYWGTAGQVSPISGTPISISTGSSLTIGAAYTIVSVGTTTLAQWQAVGLPVGTYTGSLVAGTLVAPAIGSTFIATATSGSGTGVVETSIYSGIDHIEVVGDPNQTIVSHSPAILGSGSGAYMVLQCFNAGTLTAPMNGTTIGMSFMFSNSLIQVKGD